MSGFRRAPRPALLISVALATLGIADAARAQRAGENPVTSSDDAFGNSIGNERTGLYTESDVRGFSPVTAGNRRLDGLYFDLQGPGLTQRVRSGSVIRVGLPALNYPFPAPTGIVDYRLRPAGDEAVASVAVGTVPYGGWYVEADAQLPVIPGRLSVATGASFYSDRTADGAVGDFRSFAVIPQLRFKGGEIKALVSLADNRGVQPSPIVVTGGAWLPPIPEPDVYYPQKWTLSDTRQRLYGALGRFELGSGFTLRAGAFEARTSRDRTHNALFTNVQRDGTARETVISEPLLVGRWTSGEVRLSWAKVAGDVAHSLHLSARGRDKYTTNGGADARDLGPAVIGIRDPEPRPDFAYGATTQHSVRQTIGGIAYIGRWNGVGELNLGIQKTDYRFEVERSGVRRRSEASPWLYNAAFAVTPFDWLAIYGGITRGLEETATPPQDAANRDDAAPASRTEQKDAGIRLSLGKMRLVAGVFDITKPYFTTDAANFYGEMGTVRHRGAELSFVGPITDRLNIVAGAVLMSPRVTGEAREQGRVGPKPVGTTERFARLDLDYQLPMIEGLSLNLALLHNGARVADARTSPELGGRQLTVPAVTTLDFGARYRFTIGKTPMVFRALVGNVTDERSWKVLSSRALRLDQSRRFSFFLAADF